MQQPVLIGLRYQQVMEEGWREMVFGWSDDRDVLVDASRQEFRRCQAASRNGSPRDVQQHIARLDHNIGKPSRLNVIDVSEIGFLEAPVMNVQTADQTDARFFVGFLASEGRGS